MSSSNNPKISPAIQKLYPHLSPEEQAEAEYNLQRYLNLIWRIYQRMRREDPELLTRELLKARLKKH